MKHIDIYDYNALHNLLTENSYPLIPETIGGKRCIHPDTLTETILSSNILGRNIDADELITLIYKLLSKTWDEIYHITCSQSSKCDVELLLAHDLANEIIKMQLIKGV